jgi:LuxR family maltose regulon positive regulatory protein
VAIVSSTAAHVPDNHLRQAGWAGDPLLPSKVTVPGAPRWLIARPRLDKLIAHGAHGLITTVTGPPGAGKTMAIALWLAANPPPGPLAWVSLDDYDNRPRVFWAYIVAALQRAGVAVPRAMTAAVRRSAVDHEFLLQFASVIAAQDPPVTLILDDVHVLTRSKVLDGLAFALKHAAPGLHLVVSSRLDPLLPLHRYRLSGELAEIRASDLAFTVPEARQLMAQHGVTLSAESLKCLNQRAGGWAAIMRLAAISMDGHPDPDQFVKELVTEDRAVVGYLVEEVLNAQPAHIRDFLLRTSILDQISEDIADALADKGQDTGTLAELARADGFVERDNAGWFRYHSLFAAVLRLKLRREEPERVPGLHLRAAGWYRQRGDLTAAVGHAAQAGDWQFAAWMVVDELAVGRLLNPPGGDALADRFRDMPRDGRWTQPQPWLVTAALALAQGQDCTSETFLSTAEGMLAHLPAAEEIPSRLTASLTRLALARRTGDLDAAAAAAGRAQELAGAMPEDELARHPGVHAQVLAGCGAVQLWQGHFEEAAARFRSGAMAARLALTEAERTSCLGHLALIEVMRGRLSYAAELAAEATGRLKDDRGTPAEAMNGAAAVALAGVHLERNDLAGARHWQKRAQAALRTRPDKLIEAVSCLVAARRCLAEGRSEAVSEIVGHVRQGWSPPPWIACRLMVLQSQALAVAGEFQPAVDTAVQAGPESSLDATVALAQAWLAAGDAGTARDMLASGPPGDQAPVSFRLAACLVDAQVSYRCGEPARGRRSLERALQVGEPEQHRLPFAMERKWLLPVLRRDRGLAEQYRRLLELELVSGWLSGARPPGGAEPAPVIVEPLTEREREVLQHASAMERTEEIATGMYITVNTVKTHLKSIYRKLAVTHRGEAVRRARQLGLL